MTGMLTGILMLIIGLIACFFGKRYFRAIMALQGFIVGYYFGLRLLSEQTEIIAIGAGIVVGLILALAMYQFLYKWAFWVFGAILGIVVVGLLEAAFGFGGTIAFVLLIVGAIVGAFIGNALSDLIIRISTAFAGAIQTIGGVAAIAAAAGLALPLADPTAGELGTDSTAGIISLVLVVILGIVGFMYQARHN